MLLRMLSRICRRLTGRPREREPSAKSAGESEGEERTETPLEARVEAEGQAPGESAEGRVDNLTAIRGIGFARQDRLNRAGITTYAQLAEAKPKQVRDALGNLSRGTKVEAWIRQARELAASK